MNAKLVSTELTALYISQWWNIIARCIINIRSKLPQIGLATTTPKEEVTEHCMIFCHRRVLCYKLRGIGWNYKHGAYTVSHRTSEDALFCPEEVTEYRIMSCHWRDDHVVSSAGPEKVSTVRIQPVTERLKIPCSVPFWRKAIHKALCFIGDTSEPA